MNGTSKTIYGTIAIASADNAASNALGGFKEGSLLSATAGSVWVQCPKRVERGVHCLPPLQAVYGYS